MKPLDSVRCSNCTNANNYENDLNYFVTIKSAILFNSLNSSADGKLKLIKSLVSGSKLSLIL